MTDEDRLTSRLPSKRRSLLVLALATAGCCAAAVFFHANAPGRELRFSDGSTFTLQSARIGMVAGPSENILADVSTQIQQFIAERTGWLPHPNPRRHFETRFDHDHLLVEARLNGFDREGLNKLSLALVAPDGSAFYSANHFPVGDARQDQPGWRGTRTLIFPFATWPDHGGAMILRLTRDFAGARGPRRCEVSDLIFNIPRRGASAVGLKREALPARRAFGENSEVVLSRFVVADRVLDSFQPAGDWAGRSPRLTFEFFTDGKLDENTGFSFLQFQPPGIRGRSGQSIISSWGHSSKGGITGITLPESPFWRSGPGLSVRFFAAVFPLDGPAVGRIDDLPILDDSHPAMDRGALDPLRVEPFRSLAVAGREVHLLGIVKQGISIRKSRNSSISHGSWRTVLARCDDRSLLAGARLRLDSPQAGARERAWYDSWHINQDDDGPAVLMTLIDRSAPERVTGTISVAPAFEIEFHPEVERLSAGQFDREFKPYSEPVKWKQRRVSERVTEFIEERQPGAGI